MAPKKTHDAREDSMTRLCIGRAHPSRRSVVRAGGALAIGFAAPAVLRCGGALAAYPERPVKIIVANTPGGPSDIIARTMAAAMQEATGNTFYVENKGGAGGNIGMGLAARSEPDGYTILLTTSAYSVNPGLYEKLPYDPFRDFAAICELATTPHIFVVKRDFPAGSMKDFVAMAKANPEKFNVSTPPIGTTPQLQVEVLKLREGLPTMATVVFAGGGDALKAVLSGTVQMSSGTLPPAQPHVKAGTLKGLAVTSPKRWPDLPEVPTMAEAGFDDFLFDTYTALMAPAKTPPEFVSRIETVALGILKGPQMRAKLTAAGFEVQAKTGQEHMARVRREVPRFADIIKKAGIKKL
jgi:tripartite-type tricarboxylate transporter receptor subunit TctC